MPSHKPKVSNPRKYASLKNLQLIWREFPEHDKKASGIDRITPKKFKENLDENLKKICNELVCGNFQFQKLRINPIPKSNGKHRIICIPTVRDRLVQRLILYLLTKPKDKLGVINNVSFGSMKGQGTHTAIREALKLRNKYQWVLKTDITSFFDRISRDDLIILLKKKLKNSSLMPLLEQVINAEVSVKDQETKLIIETNEILKGRGLRQGMPLSPLLSSVFLNPFDKMAIKKSLKVLRYVDDIACFCNSENECLEQKELIEAALNDIKLTIPSLNEIDSKTEIKRPDESVIFLGVEIYKCNNGDYLSKIPEKAINEILSSLDIYANYQSVLENKLNYSSLVRRLDSKLSGYKAAYKDTTNLGNFLLQYEQKKEQIKNKLFRDVLGDAVFSSLTDDALKFFDIY